MRAAHIRGGRATIGAFALLLCAATQQASAQSISLAPLGATPPPAPLPGPCLGPFSPAGDVWDPVGGVATLPMGPVGCGLGWIGPPPPAAANVNAFSTGLAPAPGGLPLPPAAVSLLFSVDGAATASGGPFACAALVPAAGPLADVNSEAGLLPPSSDAAADWFVASPNLIGPLPGSEPMLHGQFADGDGVAAPPFFLPGLGLPFGLAEPVPGGDDVDALDFAPLGAVDFAPPGGDSTPDVPVYYSVDFATAAAGGIFAADVLVTVGGSIALYAPPLLLGLDLVGGPGSDDIDALIVIDLAMDGLYDPTPTTGPDIIYYSLGPGSATLGTPDACLGLPIEEGDILADGTSLGVPGVPCIVLPQDNVGLWPARACGVNPVTGLGPDNVNAIDFHPPIVITTTTTTSTTTSTSSSTTTTGSSTTTSSTSTTTTTLGPPCGAAPEPDVSCRLAVVGGAGKSSIGINDKAVDTKDSLKWKWNKGVATTTADFKSPATGAATYSVCVYDGSGKVQEMDLPAGGVVTTCGTKPCWKATGTKGFKYKNKSGSPDGITGAKLKEGAAGKAQVQIKTKGKGGFYSAPATPLTLPVTIQLLIDDGGPVECFKTVFSAATKNDAENFKAKGP